MGDLTPFQNQVLDAAEQKEAEERERRREEARQQGGNGPQRNARANPGGSGGPDIEQEETVRYINKQENPDHEVHESD